MKLFYLNFCYKCTKYASIVEKFLIFIWLHFSSNSQTIIHSISKDSLLKALSLSAWEIFTTTEMFITYLCFFFKTYSQYTPILVFSLLQHQKWHSIINLIKRKFIKVLSIWPKITWQSSNVSIFEHQSDHKSICDSYITWLLFSMLWCM